jgi:hypothetical protein
VWNGTIDLPLDSPVDNKADCYCVSAGTNKHEHTSGVAIDSVFNFFKVDTPTSSILAGTRKKGESRFISFSHTQARLEVAAFL